MTQTSEAEDLVRAGFAALRSGERERARGLLMRAVRANPRSEQAWLYLAGALSDPAQRRDCLLRVLQLNPANGAARRGLDALGGSPAAAAVAPQTAAPAPPAPAMAPPAPPSAGSSSADTTRLADTAPPRAPAAPIRLRESAAPPPPAAPAPAPVGPSAPLAAAAPAPTPHSPGVFDAYLPPAAPSAPAPAPAPAAPLAGPGRLSAPWLDGLPLPGQAPASAPASPPPAEDRLTLWLAVTLGILLMLVSAGYIMLLLVG